MEEWEQMGGGWAGSQRWVVVVGLDEAEVADWWCLCGPRRLVTEVDHPDSSTTDNVGFFTPTPILLFISDLNPQFPRSFQLCQQTSGGEGVLFERVAEGVAWF
jgi:hypothetical protein